MITMVTIISTSDPVTSIPLHRSTLDVLQRVKSAAETWDNFLMALTEDDVSPGLRTELDRRLQTHKIIPGEPAKREYETSRRRAR